MDIEIIEKEMGDVIEIEEHAAIWQFAKVIGTAFGELLAHMEANDVKCTDPPYTRYVDVDMDAEMLKGKIASFFGFFTRKWHLQLGMMVSKALPAQGRIVPGRIENRKYVKVIHKGPYTKLGNTYKEMYKEIVKRGLALENETVEIYLNDPCETKKEDLETMILVPLKGIEA